MTNVTALNGSGVLVESERRYSNLKGYIDLLDAGKLTGWVFDEKKPTNSAHFYVAVNGNIVTKGCANTYREDLEQAGFGNGNCSFSLTFDLPFSVVAGKKITLLDDEGNTIENGSLLVDNNLHRLEIEYLGVKSHNFYFMCDTEIHEERRFVLYYESNAVVSKKVTLEPGSNKFALTLPPQFVRPSNGYFKLAVQGQPCFVWFDYVQLAPLMTADTLLFNSANIKSNLVDENRLSLLSNKINTIKYEDAALVANAYSNLTSKSLNPLVYSLANKPLYSILLPFGHSEEILTKMESCLFLSMPNENFEILKFCEHTEKEVPNHLTNIKSETDSSFTNRLARALDNARGDFIVFCPSYIELSFNSLNALTEVLNKKHIGFSTNKLINSAGELVDIGGKLEGFEKPWVNGESAFDSKWCYNQSIDYSLVSISAFRREDIERLSVPTECTTLVDCIYFWQTTLVQQGKMGVRLGNHHSILIEENAFVGSIDLLPSITQAANQQSKSNLAQPQPLSVSTGKRLLGTVLMLDIQTPSPDKDAGSYAAVQEIRLIQSLGYKVIFAAMDFVHSEQYTMHLQNEGVEVCYAPYYPSVGDVICQRLPELSAIYITRYNVAIHFIDFLKETAPDLPIIFNNADLHFLREIRSALAIGVTNTEESRKLSNDALDKALKIKQLELDVINKADAVLSYNDVEHAVITSHIFKQENIFKCPWVLDEKPLPVPFESRDGVAFLGGYKHKPNVEAVEFFMESIFPELLKQDSSVTVYFYGSHMPDSFEQYQHPQIKLVGYVENLDDVFQRHRVFIAPLLSGAGIKGKVLESAAYGLPSVLSPVAAESTGLSHNISTLIAETPQQWAEYITCLNTDNILWERLSSNQRTLANEKYSFSQAQDKMRKVFNYLKMTTC